MFTLSCQFIRAIKSHNIVFSHVYKLYILRYNSCAVESFFVINYDDIQIVYLII